MSRRAFDRPRRASGALASALALAALLAAGAGVAAQGHDQDRPAGARRHLERTDARFSFGGRLTVGVDQSAADAVAIFGALRVRGEVRGAAFVLGRDAEIDGRVGDSVVAIFGSVRLGPEAEVRGDVFSLGGSVEQAPGSRVRGVVTEIAGFGGDGWPRWLRPDRWRLYGGEGVVGRAADTAVLVVLLLLLALLLRGWVEAVAARAGAEAGKAALIGVVTQVLLVPMLLFTVLALLISVIGIPLLLLLPFALLFLALLFLVGFAGVAMACGRGLIGRAGLAAGIFLPILLGVVVLQGWSIAGQALSALGGPLQALGWLLLALGFLIKYIAWTVGLGAVVLHAFTPRALDDRG